MWICTIKFKKARTPYATTKTKRNTSMTRATKSALTHPRSTFKALISNSLIKPWLKLREPKRSLIDCRLGGNLIRPVRQLKTIDLVS